MKFLLHFYSLSVSCILTQKVLKPQVFLLSVIFIMSFNLSEAAPINLNPVLPPVAVCKNISVQLGNSGTVTINGSDVNGGSYDPDGTISSLSVSPNTFNCSQTGSNPVVLTVTDNEGLSSSCNATVTVEDKTPPVIKCRNYTLYLDAAGNGNLSASDINNGSADNCSAGLILYLNRTAFTCSDIGSTVEVTLFGTDASGNSSSCTAQVTVMDTISPVINIKPFTLVLGSTGTATLTASDIDNGTFDNCGSIALSVSPNTFTCSDLGQKFVSLTALDSHGNSSSRTAEITIASTLDIKGMTLSSCDLSPQLGLYDAEVEGGTGIYSYLWQGVDVASKPFMELITIPVYLLQPSNTSTLKTPLFNINLENGYYNIRLIVTDGNGCADSSEIKISKTGYIFNNETIRYSQACEGETKTYSVPYKSDAVYSWSVINGTILTSDPDTSRIRIMWNPGVVQGKVVTTVRKPNNNFPGGQCESVIIDTVTVTPVPAPLFTNPATTVCSNSVITYTLTGSYPYQNWTVTGGVITAGGKTSDNFVTVRWGGGPVGSISVSAGYISSCTGSVFLNVAVSKLSATITSRTDITCNGGSDGSVTAAAVPGTGQAPYSYSLDGGAFQPGGTFTGISVGNHIVKIRDALLCSLDMPFVIYQPDPVTGSVASQTGAICFGESNGSATIAPSGGFAPYQYQLNSGPFQSSNVLTGLAAGSYTVTIKDSHGCTGTLIFTITQPSLPLNGSVSVTNVNCFGESTGKIDLTVTGGVAPYTFLWNNGVTTEDNVNITGGNYSVVITDASGCKATVTATVTQPASAITGISTVTNVLCFGGTNGAVNLTVTGGAAPYSFVWNNGATTEDLLNLPAGSYSVTITDANGCHASLAITVAGPASAVGGTIISRTDVSCFGGINGTVSVTGSGGVAPYEYQLGTASFQSSGTFGSLAAGSYDITVRDANMCTFNIPFTISQPSAGLTGSISVTNVKCFGVNSGACDLTVNGGTSPYSYVWSNGATTEDIGNIAAGSYSVTVIDSRGCSVVVNAAVTQPAVALNGNIVSQSNVTEYGGNDGTVTVSGSGGTSPYTYKINSGSYQPGGTFNSLAAGTYTVTVRDAAACLFSIEVTITQPWIPLTAKITDQKDVSCNGGHDGSVTVTGWGGTLPYHYSFEGGAFQVSGTFISLAAGTYTITVRDAVMDLYSIAVTIIESDALNVSLAGEDVNCYGGNTGSVTATVTGGTSPYTFLWNSQPAQVGPVATGLSAGTYTVSVTDARGCMVSNIVTISQPPTDMKIAITQVNILCQGGANGNATATVEGGLEPYNFSWNTTPEQTKETATDLSAGAYIITVTDSHGCRKTQTVTITEPEAISVEAVVTAASCPDSEDGSITLSISGGKGPYSFQWTDGGATTQNRSRLKPGSYTVIITDQNNCSETIVSEVDFTFTSACLIIPQVITPNNDGFNDEWRIKNIDLYPDAEVRVFNRWGKMIFSSGNLSDNPWDGTIGGKPAPTDSYHYILYLNDGSEPRSGVVSIIR